MPAIEDILKLLTPFGIAIAWIYAQMRITDKEEHAQRLEIAERERQYSERLESRLQRTQAELENAMKALDSKEHPEKVLKEIVERDPGFMFVKKRLGPKAYVYLKVSRGYAVAYLVGPSEIIENRNESLLGWNFSEVDECIYASQTGRPIIEVANSPLTGIKGHFVGRKFPLNFGGQDYIIGVGDHELNKET